jgi:hypothetical protein
VGRAEILDRTVAVVGTEAIMASEVEMQIRLQAMFNGAEPDLSEAARKQALERLVEQRLVQTDMTLAGLQSVEGRELETAFSELRQGRFGEMGLEQALERYGVKERDVRTFLRRQLQFTHYVDFRFRAGLQVDDESLAAEYKRRFASSQNRPPFESMRDELREQLLAERTETMLDERVRQLRSETRIAFLDPIAPAREAAP